MICTLTHSLVIYICLPQAILHADMVVRASRIVTQILVGLVLVSMVSALAPWCTRTARKDVYHTHTSYELDPSEQKGDCADYNEANTRHNGKAFVDAMMEMADYNRDGYIDVEEGNRYQSGMSKLIRGLAYAACADVREVAAKCDANNDRRLSRDEIGAVKGCYDTCYYRHKAFSVLGK